MQHFLPTPTYKPLMPRYTHFISSPSASLPPSHVPGCFSAPPASSSPLTPSGFFNGMLAVSGQGALNFYTLFRLMPLTFFVSRNLTLIHTPPSKSLDSLLCDLIIPTLGLAFSLQMPGTLAAASSFSSVSAYLFLNFLPPLFLRLTPNLII